MLGITYPADAVEFLICTLFTRIDYQWSLFIPQISVCSLGCTTVLSETMFSKTSDR